LISLERKTTRERRKEEEKDDDKHEVVVWMTEFERWKSSKELYYSQRFLEARESTEYIIHVSLRREESGSGKNREPKKKKNETEKCIVPGISPRTTPFS
jgi:hypothetical protein